MLAQRVRDGDVRTRASLGGGALLDMGIYCINAARYVFGEEPTTVQAIQAPGTGDVDAVTAAVLGFGEGRVAQLTCHQDASDVSEFRVIGTKGDIRLEPAYDYSTCLEEHWSVEGSIHSQRYWKHDQFAPELIHFSQAVLEGVEPEPSGEEGLCDVRVIQAIRRSAQTGRCIRLAPYGRMRRPGPEQVMRKPPAEEVVPVRAPGPRR